jgi:hypothetical protein
VERTEKMLTVVWAFVKPFNDMRHHAEDVEEGEKKHRDYKEYIK